MFVSVGFIFTLGVLPGLVVLWGVPEAGAQGAASHSLLLGLGSLFTLGVAANGPKTMCGIAVRETVPMEAGGTAGGVLGLAGQIGASLAGYPLIKLQNQFGWAGVFAGLLGAVLLALLLLLPLVFGRNARDKKES